MKSTKTEKKTILISILSLSLLTVMAGAAIAPALGIIKAHFQTVNPLLIQMIISIPAIFIILTNFIFPTLCRYFGAKTLVMFGLVLYTAGGCFAGAIDNIYFVLVARALVGIGVGIIMPLSTGLLAYYFAPAKMEKLMGYSSAMNQMGGTIATLLSGLLAAISWRASFLVYLLGFFSMVLCLIFLPNDKVVAAEKKKHEPIFQKYYAYVIAMFLLMICFFIYPANFAIETTKVDVIPQSMIALIMAIMDIVGFFGGLFFVYIKIACKEKTRYFAPILFLLGYLCLAFFGGWIGVCLGSFCIGLANGTGIPYLISTASKRAGKSAATTVMPLLSIALYAAQFLTPILIAGFTMLLGDGIPHLPYDIAIVLSACFFLWSSQIKEAKTENSAL